MIIVDWTWNEDVSLIFNDPIIMVYWDLEGNLKYEMFYRNFYRDE